MPTLAGGHRVEKLDAPVSLGPSKTWIKVKNPQAPAATRVLEGGF
ncbi:MAG: hypothetical protein WCF47_14105 [Pseudolabrys sp.]